MYKIKFQKRGKNLYIFQDYLPKRMYMTNVNRLAASVPKGIA